MALEAMEEARTPAVEAVERHEVEVAAGELVRRALHAGSGDGLSPSRLQSRDKRGPHVGGAKETQGRARVEAGPSSRVRGCGPMTHRHVAAASLAMGSSNSDFIRC